MAPVARTAFAMQPDQLSEVVETESGLHLTYVADRKTDGRPSEFAKVKEDVIQICIEDMYINLFNQLRKAAKIEINLP
jgi:parvulin-like peptidyl-prolyl isomerase